MIETTELCVALEDALKRALELAGGDSNRVVLVLDLDETCITPQNADALGTSLWFEDFVKRWAPILEKQDGMNHTATLTAVLAIINAFYSKVPVDPTEAGLSALIHKFNALGVSTMGLTARGGALAPATWTQMEDRCNFEFNWETATNLEALEVEMRQREHVRDPGIWSGLTFEQGVWFTSNANKGSLMRKVFPPGMHVVFADDSRRHLVAANQALDGHAASVQCLHYTGATFAASQKLNPANCDKQMAHYLAELFEEGNAQIMELVAQQEPFLKRFILTGMTTSSIAAALSDPAPPQVFTSEDGTRLTLTSASEGADAGTFVYVIPVTGDTEEDMVDLNRPGTYTLSGAGNQWSADLKFDRSNGTVFNARKWNSIPLDFPTMTFIDPEEEE